MNIAQLLVYSGAPSVELDVFETRLRETVGVAVEPGFAPEHQAERAIVPALLNDFGNPLVASIVQPMGLETMAETRRIGLLRVSDDELSGLGENAERLVDVPDSTVLWLEADQAGNGWVVYPQEALSAPRLLLWLPIQSGPGVTRLDVIDVGQPSALQQNPPVVVAEKGCRPGFTGTGADTRQVCLEADCDHPCKGSWVVRRGDRILIGCSC
jgi:hypothetical protein